mmetsp:Transcript_42948/g.122810  ORF Transcript_42948/g.122810 Transcript_42948/m.122810 type:complete len:237 (-) Transcript_42948:2928-3638(-)
MAHRPPGSLRSWAGLPSKSAPPRPRAATRCSPPVPRSELPSHRRQVVELPEALVPLELLHLLLHPLVLHLLLVVFLEGSEPLDAPYRLPADPRHTLLRVPGRVAAGLPVQEADQLLRQRLSLAALAGKALRPALSLRGRPQEEERRCLLLVCHTELRQNVVVLRVHSCDLEVHNILQRLRDEIQHGDVRSVLRPERIVQLQQHVVLRAVHCLSEAPPDDFVDDAGALPAVRRRQLR